MWNSDHIFGGYALLPLL